MQEHPRICFVILHFSQTTQSPALVDLYHLESLGPSFSGTFAARCSSCMPTHKREEYQYNDDWAKSVHWSEFAEVYQGTKNQLVLLDDFLYSSRGYKGSIGKLRISCEYGQASDEAWTIQRWRDQVEAYQNNSWLALFKPGHRFHENVCAAEQRRIQMHGHRPLRRALRQLSAYLAPCATVQLDLPTSSLSAFVRTFSAHLTEIKGTHQSNTPLAQSRSLLRYLQRCQRLHTIRLEGYDFTTRGKTDPLRFLPSNLSKVELISCIGMGERELIRTVEDEERLPKLRVFSLVANQRELSHDGAIRLVQMAQARWILTDIKI